RLSPPSCGRSLCAKPGFPLSDVPLQAIAADVEAGRYRAKPSRVFRFEDIREGHRVVDGDQAKGKMGVLICRAASVLLGANLGRGMTWSTIAVSIRAATACFTVKRVSRGTPRSCC